MFPAVPYSRYFIAGIPWYSVLIICGIAAAILLCLREEKRLSLREDTVIDLALWAVPFGIVGARLYYVAFSYEQFADDPLSILYIWKGGLAIYGGVIGGLIAVLIFAHRRKLYPFLLTDMIVPGLALAQAIGRWGNYFNMEAYGREITDVAWQFFPAGVQIPTDGSYVWHMATFFYESMWNLLVFALLWFIVRRHSRTTGVRTLWYLLLYGAGRTFIEGLRMDSLMSGSIRISQLLSLTLVIVSALALVIIHIRSRRQKA